MSLTGEGTGLDFQMKPLKRLVFNLVGRGPAIAFGQCPSGQKPFGQGAGSVHPDVVSPNLAIMGLGPLELVIVAGVILLLFGSRLPKVMRSLGQGIVEFKRGVQGIEDDAQREATRE